MSGEIVKKLTGMNDKEIREHTWPAVTPETKIIPPRGFSTPADRERMREELRNTPMPRALKPPNTGELTPFERDMDIFLWWR